MTFSENYLNHLKVLGNVGMTRIDPVRFQGQDIVPIQFPVSYTPLDVYKRQAANTTTWTAFPRPGNARAAALLPRA